MQNATWSPGCTPAARSSRDRRLAAASSSANVVHGAGGGHDDRGLVGLGRRRRHRGTWPRKVPDGTVRAMDPGASSSPGSSASRDSSAGDPAPSRSTRPRWRWPRSCASRPTDGGARPSLDELAAGCAEPTFDGLRRHLFDELGFAGDAEHYDDPRNSFLDVVLERRRGLPILLATVMIEVGRRAGVARRRHRDADALPRRAAPTTPTPSSTRSPARRSTAAARQRAASRRSPAGRAAVGRPPPRPDAGQRRSSCAC